LNQLLNSALFRDLDYDFVITAFLATSLLHHLIFLEFLKTADAPSLGQYTPKDLGLCQLKQMNLITMDGHSCSR
jgi:hypothetical protein